jgi:hypothetical protein
MTLLASPGARTGKGVGDGVSVALGAGGGVGVGSGVGVGGATVEVGVTRVAVGGSGDGVRDGDGTGDEVEVGASSRGGLVGVDVADGWGVGDGDGGAVNVGATGGRAVVTLAWRVDEDELRRAGITNPLSTAARTPQTTDHSSKPNSNAPMRPAAPRRSGFRTIGPIFCLPLSPASTRAGPMSRSVRGSMTTTRNKRRRSSFMVLGIGSPVGPASC